MIRIIGTRGSGKTTKLLNLAAENRYVIVEPNAMMTDYVRRMAIEKGLNVNVIGAHELLHRQYGVVREKYLVDELEMFMASLGIVGYSDGLEAQDKLLKEQEPVEPTLIREGRNKYYNDYVCPRCDNEVVYDQNYCSGCGIPFLWEGR